MSKFRDETTIETFEKACPICHGDVKGDETYLYFCKQCNILFRKDDLVLDTRVIDKILKQKIVEKFEKDKDKIQIEEKPIPIRQISEKKQIILKDLKESKKYYISKK